MKLICGVDTTSEDRSPAAFAGRLSAELGAELTLAHFVPPSAAFPAEGVGRDALRDAVLSAVGDQVGETLATGRGEADGLVGFGDPAQQLLQLADSEPSAMIVVGSRGRGPAAAALLGSVSRRVITDARCPVTVVPGENGGEQRAEMDTIVVGYDGSREARVALRSAASYAQTLGAQLVLVEAIEGPAVGYRPGIGVGPLPQTSVCDRPSALRGLEAAESMPSDVPIEIEQVEGHPPGRIAEVADRAGAGMIAVGSRGRGSLGELLLGSTSSALACSGTKPVMICTRDARVPALAG